MSYAKHTELKDTIKRALAEDIGRGDITTKALFSHDKYIHAVILAGEEGIICGIDIARLVFKTQNNNVRFISHVKDAERIKKGQALATLYGKASDILPAERTALNFLGLLSGIATRTEKFVNKIKRYKVKIMDTRKTIPGLRQLEKYAVKCGGGYNHRFRLDEMVLIKENHLIASCPGNFISSIPELVNTVKEKKPKGSKLEIEVKNLRELNKALKAEPDIIMLDNMKIDDIKKAVILRNKSQRPKRNTILEASGNINLRNICAYVQTGVDVISLGTLTKDVCSLDLSLEIS